MANHDDLELLYRALGSPIGIIVSAPDVAFAIQKLYAARRAAGDKDLDLLQFRRRPEPNEIWIVKGGVVPSEELAKNASE